MRVQSIDRMRQIRSEQPLDERTKAQVVRVIIAIEDAAARVKRLSAAPGAATAYVRDHPRASNADVMLATGCSRTTAREARRAIAKTSEAQV